MRKLDRQSYDVIISDRYFYDSVVNILYLSGYTTGSLFLERFIPHPDQAFYLRITPQTIMLRNRIPEQGSEYLDRKIVIFGTKKEDWHLVEIDASQDETAVASDIAAEIAR